MNDMNLTNKIGLRCKRIRESKGMTLQALADMVNTSAANISKFEKQGISNIEWITALSDALGQDLLKDVVDEEGTVGEIGKEILIKLIENKGLLSYKDVVANMHGMSEDRVSNEIFKLTRIGMCVRELYKDYYNKQQDKIFITAKGLITCCNAITNPLIEARISPIISEVNTYENLLKGDEKLGIKDADSFQEYIDLRVLEKKIRNLPYTKFLYRADFITWLKKQYTTGFDKFTLSEYGDDHFPTQGFVHDLFYRMAIGITNEELCWKFSDEYRGDFADDIYTFEESPELVRFENIRKKLGYKSTEESINDSLVDLEKGFMAKTFASKFDLDSEFEKSKETDLPKEVDLDVLNNDDKKFYLEYLDRISSEMENEGEYEWDNPVKERFEKKRIMMHEKGINSDYPFDWFSEDEIYNFVKDNYVGAETSEEIIVDKQLNEIIKMKPEVLKYYGFNGLASRMIPDIVVNYIKEIYNIE